LNLREKIFELHDAVKELQTKPPTVIVAEEQTQTNKITSLEKQLFTLKKAVGTLADAVSEEFEQIRTKAEDLTDSTHQIS